MGQVQRVSSRCHCNPHGINKRNPQTRKLSSNRDRIRRKLYSHSYSLQNFGQPLARLAGCAYMPVSARMLPYAVLMRGFWSSTYPARCGYFPFPVGANCYRAGPMPHAAAPIRQLGSSSRNCGLECGYLGFDLASKYSVNGRVSSHPTR